MVLVLVGVVVTTRSRSGTRGCSGNATSSSSRRSVVPRQTRTLQGRICSLNAGSVVIVVIVGLLCFFGALATYRLG